MRLSLVIPTRNRHDELSRTLALIGSLDAATLGEAPELLIVDNHSDTPVRAPRSLGNGVAVSLTRLGRNAGAAARNVAALAASGDWLIMIDDDSAPFAGDFASVLADAPADLAAVGGEIFLPDGSRESGGLPEVIIGCGCAIRRNVFNMLGGYDESFGYYAEEYDLCARIIASGRRIAHTRSIRFEHRKVTLGRSFDRVLARLVRNNGWTIARYAPDSSREHDLRAMLVRYRAIAIREHAVDGFNEGLAELEHSIDAQPRTPLTREHWDRFTGIAACRDHLPMQLRAVQAHTAMLIARGKGDDLIEQVIRESGVTPLPDNAPAAARVIGTLSPGPMLDAAARSDAIAPWRPAPTPIPRARAAASTHTPSRG